MAVRMPETHELDEFIETARESSAAAEARASDAEPEAGPYAGTYCGRQVRLRVETWPGHPDALYPVGDERLLRGLSMLRVATAAQLSSLGLLPRAAKGGAVGRKLTSLVRPGLVDRLELYADGTNFRHLAYSPGRQSARAFGATWRTDRDVLSALRLITANQVYVRLRELYAGPEHGRLEYVVPAPEVESYVPATVAVDGAEADVVVGRLWPGDQEHVADAVEMLASQGRAMIVVAPTRLHALDYCRVLAGRRVEISRSGLDLGCPLEAGCGVRGVHDGRQGDRG